MEQEKKPRASKPAASVEKLVAHALKLAATNPKAKWTGASAVALFNTKEANHKDAIAECTKQEAPLLRRVDKVGTLTAAGFERIAGELSEDEARAVYDQILTEIPEEQVGGPARVMVSRLAPGAPASFIQDVIRRTPLATTELTPLLEEAVAVEKAEHEAHIAASAKRRAAEEAALKAMEREQLFEERRQNRLDAIKREWEAEGQNASELPAHTAAKPDPRAAKPSPQPQTHEEKDFRRYECDRLAAAWRDASDAKKEEGRDCLETAMWNIRGFRMIGEVGATTEFDGRYHESDTPVFTGAPVKVVRPGWLLKEDDGDYVALKAAVRKA